MTLQTEYSVSGIDDQSETRQKMIALDVDGTLVDHNGAMSPAVRRAAQEVIDAGHRVIIATGRSLGATLPVIQQLGLETGFGVCCNGAVTIRLDTSLPGGCQVIRREVFSPRAALIALSGRLPEAMYALESVDGEFLSTHSFQDASFGIEARSVRFDELLDTQAVRVVVHSAEIPLPEFERAISSVGLQGVAYSVGWSSWLDIAAAGVTKATALERLRGELKISQAATVAVGDGFNDLEMLSWASRGVAMGQAPLEVQQAADEVTGSIYRDGAAEVLRSLA